MRERMRKFFSGLRQRVSSLMPSAIEAKRIEGLRNRETNKLRLLSPNVQKEYSRQHPNFRNFYTDEKGNLYGVKGSPVSSDVLTFEVVKLPTGRKPGRMNSGQTCLTFQLDLFGSCLEIKDINRKDVMDLDYLTPPKREDRGTEYFAAVLRETVGVAGGRPIFITPIASELEKYYAGFGFREYKGKFSDLPERMRKGLDSGDLLVLENYKGRTR